MSAAIGVYADWNDPAEPPRLGTLNAHAGPGKEVFDFAFDEAALEHPQITSVVLDPRLRPFSGHQFPPQGRQTFGVFSDASPDRWGRMLMDRRLEREQRAGRADPAYRLRESDYLLGVHDAFRSGALRFRRSDDGPFLDDRDGIAAPPFVRLRELEAASLSLERDTDNTAPGGNDWLRLLIAPGGSLGGARPKATVSDPTDHPWIAKFPSAGDDYDVGGWEAVVHELARECGLRVPPSEAQRFANPYHTFLVKRFDRTGDGRRLHFASAMTLTDHTDGDAAATGASYLDLARVLIDHGVQTKADLTELWSRIVFNLLVSNADDHLRNHGFILVPGKGWRLAEAYDMNPVPGARGLSINITEADNALDLDLARKVAPYFRVGEKAARDFIESSRAVVARWEAVAESFHISARERARMAGAFQLAAAA